MHYSALEHGLRGKFRIEQEPVEITSVFDAVRQDADNPDNNLLDDLITYDDGVENFEPEFRRIFQGLLNRLRVLDDPNHKSTQVIEFFEQHQFNGVHDNNVFNILSEASGLNIEVLKGLYTQNVPDEDND